jgi:hypothetical protein
LYAIDKRSRSNKVTIAVLLDKLLFTPATIFLKTQPPVQWVPGVLSPEVKCGRGVMLTLLVPRLKKRGAIPPLHPNTFMACSGSTLLFFKVFRIIK